MRTITASFPSGRLKMTLWEGTEDEERFPIFAAKSDTPYVRAHGKRYNLTRQEIKAMRQLQRLLQEGRKQK